MKVEVLNRLALTPGTRGQANTRGVRSDRLMSQHHRNLNSALLGAELRQLSRLKKAVLTVQVGDLSHAQAAVKFKLHEKQVKENRDPGVNGRPNLMKQDVLDKYIERLTEMFD